MRMGGKQPLYKPVKPSSCTDCFKHCHADLYWSGKTWSFTLTMSKGKPMKMPTLPAIPPAKNSRSNWRFNWIQSEEDDILSREKGKKLRILRKYVHFTCDFNTMKVRNQRLKLLTSKLTLWWRLVCWWRSHAWAQNITDLIPHLCVCVGLESSQNIRIFSPRFWRRFSACSLHWNHMQDNENAKCFFSGVRIFILSSRTVQW